MLKPKTEITVRESSIRDLPTKPTQINSVTRLPHIRNQHVADKNINKINKKQNQDETSYNGISSEDKTFKHTLGNGKTINLNVKLLKNYHNNIQIKDAVNLLHKISNQSLGYIKGNDYNNISLDKKFFDDFGINEFLEKANVKDEAVFNLDFLIDTESDSKNKFAFDLYHDKHSFQKAIFTADFQLEPSYDRIKGHLDYIEVENPTAEKGIGVSLQAKIMNTLRNTALENGLNKVHVDLTAGLTTGPYLWNECGYLVNKTSRENYAREIENSIRRSNILIDKETGSISTLFTNNEYAEAYSKRRLSDYALEFNYTGNTDYIKGKFKALYEELPGVRKKYANHIEWFKDCLQDMSFSCTFDFKTQDSPETNEQLHKLNKRYEKTYGKPMEWRKL